jgi:hypothetical protein
VIFGVTIGGLLLGRRRRHRSETLREPFSILQTSLLGVVGLLLAFGLALPASAHEPSPGDAASAAGDRTGEPVGRAGTPNPSRVTLGDINLMG